MARSSAASSRTIRRSRTGSEATGTTGGSTRARSTRCTPGDAIRPDAPEEVMLDLVDLARGHDFYDVAEFEVSPDNRLLAYAEDTVGRRQYSLRFKDLVNGTTLPDVVPNVEPAVVWNADGSSVLYVEKDPETLLGTRVRRHVLGTDPSADPVVYEEADDSFYLDVGRSKDGRYLYIYSQSTVSTEQRCRRCDGS